MKVYVLTEHCPYHVGGPETNILSVYSNKEKAEKEADKLNKATKGDWSFRGYSAEEFELIVGGDS